MRQYLFIIIAAAALMACSSSRMTPREKAEKDAMTAHYVREAVEKRHFTIDVDYMMPQRGGMRHLSYGYELRVSGDSIYSYLPYFGQAWQVPYGGGKGLWFESTIGSYEMKQGKKGKSIITITVTNDEDRYTYMLSVHDNGAADLTVYPQNKDKISYNGMMRTTQQ